MVWEREIEFRLGEVVLPDPQPLTGWHLEVVELAHQAQVAEVDTEAPVGIGDRRSRVLQLPDAELDRRPILIAQQQILAERRPRAPLLLPGRLSGFEQQVQVVVAWCPVSLDLVRLHLGDLRRARSAETPFSGLSHLIWSAVAILSALSHLIWSARAILSAASHSTGRAWASRC